MNGRHDKASNKNEKLHSEEQQLEEDLQPTLLKPYVF